MLTQCPRCETIYRLNAADLGAAQGFVECGECGAQFSALQRLADEPKFSASAPQDPVLAPPEEEPPAATAGPAFVLMDPQASSPIPEVPPLEAVGEATAAPDSGADAPPNRPATPDQPSLFEISPAGMQTEATLLDIAPAAARSDELLIDIDPQGSAQTLSDSEHAILFTDPSAQYEEAENSSDPGAGMDDVPAILQEDVAGLSRSRSPLRWLWFVLVLLFFGGFSAQLAWIFRDQIIAAAPEFQPTYVSLCAQLKCKFETEDAPNAIELVARDVRDHPQYRDTLLVNATLISRSTSASSYPIIELGLYGQTGEVIGIRRFGPREYLDKSIDMAAGMPPERPVYIVMEIAGIGRSAVSFEFTFL